MPDRDPQRKRDRERDRRKRFTPEEKAAAAEHSRLYQQNRRLTDASYVDRTRKATRRLYRKHHDRRIAAMRERNQRLRRQCIDAYGGVCACCGEANYLFLTLDHIMARGDTPEAVRVGGNRMGQNLYAWCVRNGFPEGLRVLCFNCNCGRHANNGVCPHEAERLRKAG